jgi:redox-sensitive bicupin YhaK (pirin superfamily)
VTTAVERGYLILAPEDHVVLGESDFGTAGLVAIESIGPFGRVQASGPLITVHDSVVEAGLGIGHHPHRFNERLFFIEQGELDHDDALNGITGHMDRGDVGQFTEGRRGMVHSEWNHGDVDTHAFILVYTTDPIPERTAFGLLKDADAPIYEEPGGVRTKELVGPRSPLRVNGDIRLFAESHLDPGDRLDLAIAEREGGLASVRTGRVAIDGTPLDAGATVIFPPGAPRTAPLRATQPSRIVRVVHGPGQGFVTGEPMARRDGRT